MAVALGKVHDENIIMTYNEAEVLQTRHAKSVIERAQKKV